MLLVDGGWSAWKEFSPCTASDCGNGIRMMRRFCTNPSPENGGKICKGIPFKTEFCMGHCPGMLDFDAKIYKYNFNYNDSIIKELL